MATAPSKSQPLRNFSMPQLKWAQKNSSSYRRRDSPDQRPAVSMTPTRNDSDEQNGEEGKPWNLRPRKGVVKAVPFQKKEICAGDFGNFGDLRNEGVGNSVNLQRVRGLMDGGQQGGGGLERKEKTVKLWISLSREEIEEDVYALTGSRPARRPRKWPKNVQKQLDVQVICTLDYIWWELQRTHIGFMMLRNKCSVADKFRHLMQWKKELDLVPKIMEVVKHVIDSL